MTSFEAHLKSGEEYLKAARPDLALPELLQALEQSAPGEKRMRISNTIARVQDLMGHRKEAIQSFESTLAEPETGERSVREQKAVALNNLGRLSLPQDPDRAISFFDKAISIYTDLLEDELRFGPHLAHSLMARGEAYYLKEKYWYAKKDYKQALELNQNHSDVLGDEMLSLVYYQLGLIYTDEFNAYDAHTNYRKALEIYESLLKADPQKYRPLVAATLNNLAVVQIQLEDYDKALENYQRTLEAYEILSEEKPTVFIPYLAATYSNIGILLADQMKQYPEAYGANKKAIEYYSGLAKNAPDKFTHYLATAYHNAGIYTLETDSWTRAEDDLAKALSIRKTLAGNQKAVFGPDYNATALNLLEFYQRMLEEERRLEYQSKGRELLEEMEGFLDSLPAMPSSENMQEDFNRFRDYFATVDVETIHMLDVLEKIRLWDQEIDSTLVLADKGSFQDKILAELRNFFKEYPRNQSLRKQMALALNNKAWLHLCAGEVADARLLLEEGRQMGISLKALDCNQAHCELLEGNTRTALDLYKSLFGSRNASGLDFREVVLTDLKKLHGLQVLNEERLNELNSLGKL